MENVRTPGHHKMTKPTNYKYRRTNPEKRHSKSSQQIDRTKFPKSKQRDAHQAAIGI